MPVKEINSVYQHPDELHFTLPHTPTTNRRGGSGSLTIRRLPDGGAEISTRENINEWGSTETVRFDADAWRIVQAFAAGGEGGSFLTPALLSWTAEQIRAEMTAREDKE